jgi:tRNA A-37 threonylcarbamoyl transferase component Bud32
VWRAYDGRLADRPVALKLLKEEFLEQRGAITRFEAEADALAKVQHPNIVGVIDRGVWASRRYIAMEFVEGEALSAWLERYRREGRSPPIVDALGIFDQLCAGIAAAHAVRVPGPIVHRDLKPDNVIVRALPNGERAVKVLDFGIAQLGQRKSTQTGALMGTPLYMAPEQAMGKTANLGPWTDVFALGVLLVELLTTHAQVSPDEPWWGTSLQHPDDLHTLLVPLRADVPKELWSVAARCLHAQGSQRYTNASELRAALHRAAMPAFDAGTPSQLPKLNEAALRDDSSLPPATGGGFTWLETPREAGERRPAVSVPRSGTRWGRLVLAVVVAAMISAAAIVALLVSLDARRHGTEATPAHSSSAMPRAHSPPRNEERVRTLATRADLASFIERWERMRRRAPGAEAMERLYATSLKYHGVTRPPDFAQMTRDLDRVVAHGGSFALDYARTEWTDEALDSEVVPAACRAVRDATGPVLRVRAWASETRNDRHPDIGCPRIEGRYLLRLRQTSDGLRICQETWSIEEAICSSCPSAPMCARR